jgi:hypothetical protein
MEETVLAAALPGRARPDSEKFFGSFFQKRTASTALVDFPGFEKKNKKCLD